MKNSIYILICFFAILLLSCQDDNTSTVMKRQSLTNQFQLYKGNPYQGGIADTTGTSNLPALLSSYFISEYNNTLTKYQDMTVEFMDGDKMTYVYRDSENKLKKIVSTYRFSNDSLYVINNVGSKIFVALGTKDELYLPYSYSRYTIERNGLADTTIIKSHNYTINLDTVLHESGYESLDNMQKRSNIIMWWNIRYTFKRQ